MNKVYCPVINFKLSRECDIKFKKLIINENIKIVSKEKVPDLKLLNNYLTDKDIKKYSLTLYWLSISGDFTNFEIETQIIFFQLALWILIPTKTVIPFMTNFNEIYVPLYQRFQHNPEYSMQICDLIIIKEMGKNFSKIYNIYIKYKKVNLAMLYTFDSCLLRNWDASFVLMVTAFESILCHKAHICKLEQKRLNWGLTKKLSWTYAILSENDNSKRQSAFEGFRYVYEIRSDLVHGKTIKNKYKKGNINLKKLAKCRDMLRKLWQVILNSEEIIENLSGNDKMRKDYFKRIANGWMPEVKDEKGK